VSPTVFRAGKFRFFFFSREETRPHVHVETPNGEAKYWLDPDVILAGNWGLPPRELREANDLIEEHEGEIREAWHKHFGR
jgi:hypothetical protein